MAVGNLVKKIQDIMRKDSGVDGDAQRIGQMVWMFFLKIYDAKEDDWAIDDENYVSIIPEPLRWRNWACHKDENGKERVCMTGDELLGFINNVLFPVLKGEKASIRKKRITDEVDEKGFPIVEYEEIKIEGIKVDRKTPRFKAIVHEVFKEALNYMKNGQYLREVINVIDDVDFYNIDESHAFGDLYENILKDLQSAGHAGEFYTPRALTDFIIQILNPHIGEVVGDFAMGTGGFLISALRHLEPQCTTNEDFKSFQNSVVGQEWKPLPYLLGVTNVMLHDIKNPNLRHMDSLGVQMSTYRESGKVNVIAMNPPYGGATSDATKLNFKEAFRSSETADLFLVLIMERLERNGRAGVIVPDGFLFGNDNAKMNIKARMLKEFNLHTIIRLPGSIFSPYTSIATNILFFDNQKDCNAPEGYSTAQTWFYRLDMPEGYKHFSKTKPMKLEHTKPIADWWNDRREIVSEDGTDEKSRSFTPQELEAMGMNLDQCKFPKESEEILEPAELLRQYHEKRAMLEAEITQRLESIDCVLNGNVDVDSNDKSPSPWSRLAELHVNLPRALRKSILQEAIMGKLGTNDPNDEPATELLRRILAEKAKQIKGKKIKKEKPLPDISNEEKPFEIPDNWTWCRLKDCADVLYGFPFNSQQFNEIGQGMPLIRIRDVVPGYSKIHTTEVADNKYIIKEGDMLVGMDGNFNVAYWKSSDAYLNQRVCRITTKDCYLSQKFLYYYLPRVLENICKDAHFVTVKHLSDKHLSALLVPLPPLAEQHRIVEKLEKILPKLKEL